MTSSAAAVHPEEAEFRRVLGQFATGVAAVTGLHDGAPVGMVVNSFSSVSLDPPLVAFCVAHTSRSWPRLRLSRRLGICFLAAGQHTEVSRLASSGGTKFRDLVWSASPGGAPILDGALAWLECSVETEHPAGDHLIVVARVHHLDGLAGADPLVFYGGVYGRFAIALPESTKGRS